MQEVVGSIVDEIRGKDLLMSNYVAMYFDDLFTHILELKKKLKNNAVCAYVVGNSRIKKSMVETDVLLDGLFQQAGFSSIRLEEIRRRNSGKELHETIVFADPRPTESELWAMERRSDGPDKVKAPRGTYAIKAGTLFTRIPVETNRKYELTNTVVVFRAYSVNKFGSKFQTERFATLELNAGYDPQELATGSD